MPFLTYLESMTERASHRRKHHIIYKTTCVITGHYYIGMHSTDDLDDGYLGSGKRLQRSVKKHGENNHIREVVEMLPDRSSLIAREAEIVTEELMQDPLCMNLYVGGGGYVEATDERSQNISRSLKGKRVGLPTWNKGKTGIYTVEQLAKMSEAHKGAPSPMKGKHHSAETRELISLAKTGKKHTEQSRKNMGDARRGKKHSPEAKLKMSQRAKEREAKKKAEGHVVSIETRQKMSLRVPWNKGLSGEDAATPETRARMSVAAKQRKR